MSRMRAPTERDKDYLRAIRDYTAEHGYAPRYQELGRLVGNTGNGCTVYFALLRLEKKGLIKRRPRNENGRAAARSLVLTDLARELLEEG